MPHIVLFRPFVGFLVVMLASLAPHAAATDPGTCAIRGTLLGSVAAERDKGVSKKAVMKKLSKRGFVRMRSYVDLVYSDDMKTMTPKEVESFTIFACSRE